MIDINKPSKRVGYTSGSFKAVGMAVFCLQHEGDGKMKLAAIFGVLLAAVLWMGAAVAVPSGGSVEFAGGPSGKVVFDGKVHADKELKCPVCHPKVFQMKKGATKFTMADINAGKACGTCHNGDKAFKASDPANCAKCHKK